jgi:hypothetical protein
MGVAAMDCHIEACPEIEVAGRCRGLMARNLEAGVDFTDTDWPHARPGSCPGRPVGMP